MQTTTPSPRTWLPDGWQHPTRVALPTGHHLRPLRATDVDLHLTAVLGSRERLWATYGEAWGWPPSDLGVDLDRDELARLESDAAAGTAFGYALLDPGETELLGRVTIRPAAGEPAADEPAGADIWWWVVDWLVGGPIEAALDAFVPAWISSTWPLRGPRFNPPLVTAAVHSTGLSSAPETPRR